MLERVPVRWRIAGICAALTFAILVVFALVLGSLVGDRIRNDREQELQDAATALAAETRIGVDLLHGVVIESPQFRDFAMADDAIIRVVDSSGRTLARGASTDPSTDLGPPSSEVERRDGLGVASKPIDDSAVPAYVQYARPNATVEATVDRLWFFLGAGVLGGTLLALLAGFGVADRAMRPIASLTALAREIATTRDPSRRLPVRSADDEIGELARTMDGMLEALDSTRSERERAFERQREFVADASHELRTPLTSVQANLELLRDGDGGEDDREAIDSALASTRRMSRLVSDLLLLARADAGRRAARTVVDLAGVARGAHDEVLPIAGERIIRARIEGPLEVRGNPDELHRLVLNLLENAIRHTPLETTVSLTAGPKGRQALIEVADDGPGIPAERRQQVFERFVRGEGPADTVGGGGSGLGLAIVRAVAQAHDGSVELGESDQGGARFSVRLPLALEADGASAASEEAGAALFRGA